MSLFSRLNSWYRALFHSSAQAAEVSEEIQFHIQAHTDSLIASGISPEEALRQAKAFIGSTTAQNEKYIQAVGLRPLNEIWGDVRIGLRSLLRTPLVTAVAVLSLALGIGATVTVYSVIYDAMLHPYPYDHPERIIQIRLIPPDITGPDAQFGFLKQLPGQQLQQLRSVPGIEDGIGMLNENVTITGGDIPESPDVTRVTGNSFQFLGIPALLGRMIQPSDAPDGQDPQPVAVISYEFWKRHYSGDPAIVGKSIQLNHADYRIVGVIPERHRWMNVDIFLPLKLQHGTHYGHLEKIRAGTSISALTAQLTSVYEQFQHETPKEFPPHPKLHVTNILEGYAFQLSGMLYTLLGAVVLLLLIACANVSILLLARGSTRRHEFAVRAALGASRYRIARQLLVESLLLSMIGTGLGIAISYASIGLVASGLPHSFAPEAEFQINIPILVFSIVLSVCTGVLFGIFPALDLTHAKPQEALQSGSGKIIGSSRSKRLHDILIAGQIALTLLLLISAGTTISGFVRILNTPLGFNQKNVLALPVLLRQNTYTTIEQRIAYFKRIRQSLLQVPGVASVSISLYGTPPISGGVSPFEILGDSSSAKKTLQLSLADTNYFRTLQIPVLKGQVWSEAEIDNASTHIIVNHAFVSRYFPNSDPIGRSIRVAALKNNPPNVLAAPGSDGWLQITGVVADSANAGLVDPPAPAIYIPYTLFTGPWIQPLVRTHLPALGMLQAIRKQLATIDPDQSMPKQTADIETYIRQRPEWLRWRLVAILFSVFSAIALILAALGLYSVSGYRVAQRTSEFGIRLAFGARRADILRIAIASSASSVLTGIMCGFALIFALRKPLAVWIPDLGGNYALLAGTSIVMLVAVFISALLPALRATGADAMKSLRHN